MTGELIESERRWRHLDVFGKKTYIVASTREGYCRNHDCRFVERVPWAAPGARHTRVFDRQVAGLVQVADKTTAHRMFGVTWRTVSGIVLRVVDDLLPKGRFFGLQYIGVDETSYKRSHHYLTVVTNLLTRRVIWVGDGKGAATLGAFFRELGAARCKKITMVAMDMGEAYQKAVRDHLPNADIVFDRFHVVKLLLEAVDEIRRDEVRKLKGEDKIALKRTKYALLRNPTCHLSPKDLEAIGRIKSGNRRLARAYELRCEFEELWEIDDPEEAELFIMHWTRSALLSRRKPLRRFANTVRRNIDGILGFFEWNRQTSGLCEGINNKIKLAIHRAFGFHSVEALGAMVYLCCGGINIDPHGT
jgi:transposase